MPRGIPAAKQAPAAVEAESSKSVTFILAESFGLIIGHKHECWPAGTAFSAETDGALISALAQAGAILEEK